MLQKYFRILTNFNILTFVNLKIINIFVLQNWNKSIPKMLIAIIQNFEMSYRKSKMYKFYNFLNIFL